MSDFYEQLMLAREIYSGVLNPVQKKRFVAGVLFPDEHIDVALSKMEYFIDNGRPLDLDNPCDISSKLHWMKINFRRNDLGDYVNKVKAREIVSERIGEEYLPLCYWVGKELSVLDRSKLPNKFALKANHSWNKNIFCFDKNLFDWDEAISISNEWMKDDHYLMHGEWAYSQINEPLLIIEELLTVRGKIPDDYKIYCFHGEPKLIKYDSGRDKTRMQMHLDINWNVLPFHNPNYLEFDKPIHKPQNLDEMILLSKKLSSDLPFVRIDFYNIEGKVYFGEFTLYPCGGNLRFVPDNWNYIIGKYLNIKRVIHTPSFI